jgi:hypothetical protein
MSLSPRSSVPDDPLFAVKRVAALAASRAELLDAGSGTPDPEIEALGNSGLLIAPFSHAVGGEGLAQGEAAARDLPRLLAALGRASLPLGRLYEGHVNAASFVQVYGSMDQL